MDYSEGQNFYSCPKNLIIHGKILTNSHIITKLSILSLTTINVLMLPIQHNMGTRDLPDMYGLRPSGIHIRQISHAHVTTITCTTLHMWVDLGENRDTKPDVPEVKTSCTPGK